LRARVIRAESESRPARRESDTPLPSWRAPGGSCMLPKRPSALPTGARSSPGLNSKEFRANQTAIFRECQAAFLAISGFSLGDNSPTHSTPHAGTKALSPLWSGLSEPRGRFVSFRFFISFRVVSFLSFRFVSSGRPTARPTPNDMRRMRLRPGIPLIATGFCPTLSSGLPRHERS